MCNPALVVAGATAALSYQQNMQAQRAARDAQNRQNEIATRNLYNRRNQQKQKLNEKIKIRTEKLGKNIKKLKRDKSRLLAEDRGFGGNTFNFLLGNYEQTEAEMRNITMGNITSDQIQTNINMSYLNDAYDAQTTYVTQPDALTTGLSSGLQFAGSYYNYKAQQNANNVSNDPYSYDVSNSGTYAQTDFEDYE